MEYTDVTLVPEDDQSSEILSFMCSICKKESKSEGEHDTHVEKEHQGILTDDKEALKKTSELTAALNAISTENPDILILQNVGDEEKVKTDEFEEEVVNIKEEIMKTKQEHIKETQDKGVMINLKCNQCEFTTETERELRIHKKNTHEVLLSCNQCLIKTKSKEQLKIHKQEAHYMNIKCEKCDFKAKGTTTLKVHILKKHLKIEMFQCDECVKKFPNRGLLALHKKKHIPAFKCEYCNFRGVSLKSVQVHKLHNHIPNSFSNIGSKRDHTMVPKSNISIGNSPPKKFKKIETKSKSNEKVSLPKVTKDVVGGAGWSLNNIEEEITRFEVSAQTCKECGYKAASRSEMATHHKENHNMSVPKDMIRKGLEELPQQVKALAAYNDCLRQKVLGNGACGPNCAATHLWLDGRKGTEFSRDLNTHIGIHSEEYLEHISFPRTVILGNGHPNQHFQDTEEGRKRFVDFLVADPGATYMWRESLDIQAMSNMSNLEIDVVKVDQHGNIIYIQQYFPNPNFKWIDRERPTSPKEKMTLIHQSNHFDLIIKKSSTLAQDGTLEYQEKEVQPTNNIKTKEKQHPTVHNFDCDICNVKLTTKNALEVHRIKEHVQEVIKTLQNENITLKVENNTLKQQMMQGENENRQTYKCKECGQVFELKTDLEDHYKQNHHLSKSDENEWHTITKTKQTKIASKAETPQKTLQKQTPTPKKVIRFSEIWNCEHCDNAVSTKSLLEAHMRNKHNQQSDIRSYSCICENVFVTQEKLDEHYQNNHIEKHFLCDDCDFQATTGLILKKHMQQVHHRPSELMLSDELGSFLKCRDCDNEFTSKPDLMDHRRDNHSELIRKCKYLREGTCRYPDSVCWYNHDTQQKAPETNNEGRFKCHTCENKYSSKSQLMKHRKLVHPDILPLCKDGNRCTFSRDECRFRHDDQQGHDMPEVWIRDQPPERYTEAYQQNTHTNTNFWPVLGNQVPPDQLLLIMREMKSLIIEMKNQMRT